MQTISHFIKMKITYKIRTKFTQVELFIYYNTCIMRQTCPSFINLSSLHFSPSTAKAKFDALSMYVHAKK